MKEYIIGIDLGRENDPTAMVIGRQILTPAQDLKVQGTSIMYTDTALSRSLSIVYAEQIPLRTTYPDIARRIVEIAKGPTLADRCDIIMDATGVGSPVVDLVREGGVVAQGVVITGGDKETLRDDRSSVPKLKIVDSIVALLHSQRITFARGLPLSQEIQKQLSEFQLKRQASGKVKYENSLDTVHDDLVIALGLVCWWFIKLYGGALTYRPNKSRLKVYKTDPFRGTEWRREQKQKPFLV